MEIFGKVTDIVLSREGTSQNGNHFEVYTVVLEGNEKVAADVFGTREHLEKHGITIGAEGKFTVTTNYSKSQQGRYFNRIDMDARTGFIPLGGKKVEAKAAPEPTEDEKKIMDLLGLTLEEARKVIAEKKKKQEVKAEEAAQVAKEGDPLPF